MVLLELHVNKLSAFSYQHSAISIQPHTFLQVLLKSQMAECRLLIADCLLWLGG